MMKPRIFKKGGYWRIGYTVQTPRKWGGIGVADKMYCISAATTVNAAWDNMLHAIKGYKYEASN